MSAQKTLPTDVDPAAVIAAIPDPRRRADLEELCRIMTEVSGKPPVIWGRKMFGFGVMEYRYASGHTGIWPQIAFAPGTAHISLYLNCSLDDLASQLAKLGKHTHGVGCIYIKRLDDVDRAVLREMIEIGFRSVHPT